MSARPTRTWRVRCLVMTVMDRSVQGQPRHLDLDVGFQIDGLVVVDETHVRRVADYQGQRYPARDDPAASGGVELRHKQLAVFVPDFDPGFASEFHPQPAFAARGL